MSYRLPAITSLVMASMCFVSSTAPAAVYAPIATRAATQTFAPDYRFETTQTVLGETADAIYAMGSDNIKFGMSYNAFGSSGYSLGTDPGTYPTLRAMAENEPTYRHVFDMPFRVYAFWAYVRGISGSEYHGYWRDGLSTSESTTEYNEIRELAEYLLNHYNGTGKTFLIGHWEGDWAVRGHYDANTNPSATAVQGMIDWLKIRQKAVEDARAAVPGSDVKVLHYSEVNLVNAWEQGWTKPWQLTVHKDVIPQVVIDLVSYSSYETAHILDPGLPFPNWLQQCLSAIESKTTFTAAAPYSRKVFIGEYGASVVGSPGNYTPAQQADLAVGVLKGAAGWGAPFVFYWQMYDNEAAGFWLIDSTNAKQLSYYRHQEYLGKVNTLKNACRYWLARNPSYAEVTAFSAAFDTYTVSGQIDTLLNSAEYAAAKTNAQYLTVLFSALLGTTNTSDPDYVAYLAQLNGGTPRATVLNSIMTSSRFSSKVSNTAFVQALYMGALRRTSMNWVAPDVQAALAALSAGTPRATVWRSILNSEEFRTAELAMRDDDTVGSPAVADKYFFATPFARADDTAFLYE